ncbi:uncharacterized protein LOC126778313 [Nymphalis io]|uniref:uncharacterized protein LOC126778313 n=1 Tax=Inachis io TaxID=171585 RepID=UPI002166FA40|nr:uncharacterized protein LOC126778313 [Nymphalis io]
MNNLYIVLSNLFFFILHCLNYNVVEARRGDVIPLGSIIGSSEMRHLKDSQTNQHRVSYEDNKAEFPQFRKRKTKKKHKAVKNKNSLLQHSEAEEKQRFKHKGKKRNSKRFIKTTFKNIDKDSNLSDSDDKNKNPVDIIVHIKMKE